MTVWQRLWRAICPPAAAYEPPKRHGDLTAYGAKVRYTTDRSYDYNKARAAVQAAKKTSPSGMPLRVKTKTAQRKVAVVQPIRRLA